MLQKVTTAITEIGIKFVCTELNKKVHLYLKQMKTKNHFTLEE